MSESDAPKLELAITQRGFGIVSFKDSHGRECSLRESSQGDDYYVWLGCDEIELKRLTPDVGWEAIPTPREGPGRVSHIANTRMHLSRDQARALLPFLQRFVETGRLSYEDGDSGG